MKAKNLFLLFILTAAMSILTALALPGPNQNRPAFAPGKVKIRLTAEAYRQVSIPEEMYAEAESFRIKELDDFLAELKVSKIIRAHRKVKDTAWEQETGFNRWFILILPPETELSSAIAALKSNRYIETAVPEHLGYPDAIPNDLYHPNNWGHNNTAQLPAWDPPNYYNGSHSGDPVGTVGFDSNAQAAWDDAQGYGSATVVIAIIDTGVDLAHPDLRLTTGYDFGDNDSNPSPNTGYSDFFHGTCCAGIAAAKTNNSTGVSGIAGGCTVMPLKVCTTSGYWELTYVTNALTYAADHGANVISMSFGFSPVVVGDYPATDNAIVYAYSHGVVLFASAGNDNMSSSSHYPSCHPQVISVGAAAPSGERKSPSSSDGEYWWGSNYPAVIMAPTILPATDYSGSLGLSTNDYYLWFNGTSCSSPYAAGVAALMLSKHSSLTPTEIKSIMTSSATDMTVDGGAGYDIYTGYGLVNAQAALALVGNSWTGAISTNWNNALNWSWGIPTSDSDVLINTVSNGRYPTISTAGMNCRSLSVNTGASLNITGTGSLTVHGNLEKSGSIINAGILTVEGNLLTTGVLNLNTAANLNVYGDLVWKTGSIASCNSNNCHYTISGNMTFESNSNVSMNFGIFYFSANGNSTIYLNDDARIAVLYSYKASPYVLTIDGSADKDLFLATGLQVDSGYRLNIIHQGGVYMEGHLVVNGLLTCSEGAFIFDGDADCNITCSSTNGSYFNQLTINLDAAYTAYLLTPIKVNAGLWINSGYLNSNSNSITIQGNWTNTPGEGHFIAGTGTVTFTGQQPSTCYGEHFYRVVNNKYETEQLIIAPGENVRIAYYDWTDGVLRVNGGYLMIDDLADASVAGYWLIDSGEAEIHQDSANNVNLTGTITMHGGMFRIVYEGAANISTWTAGSISMSAGVIEFPNSGISIPSGTTYFNCTGGTVRTPYNLSVGRAYLHIQYLNFEMYGSTNATLSVASTSSLGNLTINKASREGSYSQLAEGRISLSEEGGGEQLRTNTVTLITSVRVGYVLNIASGTLNVNGYGIEAYGGVVISGNLQMASGSISSYTADFTWNSGSTTNVTGGNISCEGNWAFNAGSAAHLEAIPITLTTDGGNLDITSCSSDSWFGNLTLLEYEGVETPFTLNIASTVPLQIHGTLTLASSMITFDLGSKAVSVNGNVTVNSGAKLKLGPNAVLYMANGMSLNVNAGGTLECLGNLSNNAKITRQSSGNYNLNMESSSTISAEYTIFEYMGTLGVNIKNGAQVNATHSLHYCTFQNGASGGSLLTINNGQTLTIYSPFFPANTWSGTYNVSKTANQGVVIFENAAGSFSGTTYENDPNGRIYWNFLACELSVQSFAADYTSRYVCEPVVISTTILNNSSNLVAVPIRVDVYLNRTALPGEDEAGDLVGYVNSLGANSFALLSFPAISNTVSEAWHTWFRVDRLHEILETNEANNGNGYLSINWNPLPAPENLTLWQNPASGMWDLQWTYPPAPAVNRFNIYRSANATGPFTTPIGTSTSTSYSDPQSGQRYFYLIKAEKTWP